MRTLMLLLALTGCDAKSDTSEEETPETGGEPVLDEGCATWVMCCEHQCATQAEYDEWAADPVDCDVECDTASPGPVPGECLLADDGASCSWQ